MGKSTFIKVPLVVPRMLKVLQGTSDAQKEPLFCKSLHYSFHIKLHISLLSKLISPGTSAEEVCVCCGDVLSSDLQLFVRMPDLFSISISIFNGTFSII